MTYVIVWEFRINPQTKEEFVRHYGPDGSRARFFRQSKSYIRTELTRDVADPLRFLMLDYWRSQSEFETFRDEHLAEYERLDKKFESLTEKETRLGEFWIAEEVQKLTAKS